MSTAPRTITVPLLRLYPSDDDVQTGVRMLLSQARDMLRAARARVLKIEVPLEKQRAQSSKINKITLELTSPNSLLFDVNGANHISSTTADLDDDGNIILHNTSTVEKRHMERKGNSKRRLWLLPYFKKQEGWPATLPQHDFLKLYRGLQKLSRVHLPAEMSGPNLPVHKFEIMLRFT